MFICGFTFAVYKNFTAIDTHTVHEKEIVEWRVEDTSGVEAFVRNFAKTYYSWSGNKDSVAQRTDALTGYLTEDLQRLTADTVRSDVAVSLVRAGRSDLVCGAERRKRFCGRVHGSADDFGRQEKGTLYPAFTKRWSTRTITEKWSLHKAPTITGKPARICIYAKKPQNPTERFLRLSENITDFLTTFYAVSDGDRKELSYYVSGDSMPPVKCADYTFSQLKSTVLNKNGDTVTATVAVEYLDSVTQMTQISQFELVLKLVDEIGKLLVN